MSYLSENDLEQSIEIEDMISVVIPCFHNNDTIRRAAQSAVEQNKVSVEVIIVDNGRTLDRSVLEGLDGVRVLDVPDNIGPSGARNEGVKNANGEYIAFLDADDWWDKDKLRKQLKVMKEFDIEGESPKIVFTAREIYDQNEVDTGKMVPCDRIVGFKKLLRSNQISCSSVLMKRETALAFPMQRDDIHEDYICWLSILKEGGYAYGINKPLLLYTARKDSKSGSKLHSAAMTYGVYKYMGIPFPGRLIYMCTYALNGIKKHIL